MMTMASLPMMNGRKRKIPNDVGERLITLLDEKGNSPHTVGEASD